MNIDGAVKRPGGAMTTLEQEEIARQHLLRMEHEGQQQLELRTAERHNLAALGSELPPAGIQHPAGEAVNRTGACRPPVNVSPAISAPQDGAHAGQQLTQAERLGQVVIGPHLKGDDTIGFAGDPRHDDQRHPIALVEELAQAETAVRQAQIKQHERRMQGGNQLEHLLCRIGEDDVKAMVGEKSIQQTAKLKVIVDDEDESGSLPILRW